MSLRLHTGMAAALIALGLAAAAFCGIAWYRVHGVNAQILGADPTTISEDAAPAARFAKAYALRRRGAPQAAGDIYRDLLAAPETPNELAVHFNLGNLYFLQAAVAADETRLRDLVPLVLRARTHYQRVLYLDSDHYDAKYNLEYVERLMQDRSWDADETRLGADTKRSQSGTGWVSVHELPEGLP